MNVAWTKIVLLAAGGTMNIILMGEKCAILCLALEQNRTPNIKCRITPVTQVVVSMTAAMTQTSHSLLLMAFGVLHVTRPDECYGIYSYNTDDWM
jgi:hypothetical protein